MTLELHTGAPTITKGLKVTLFGRINIFCVVFEHLWSEDSGWQMFFFRHNKRLDYLLTTCHLAQTADSPWIVVLLENLTNRPKISVQWQPGEKTSNLICACSERSVGFFPPICLDEDRLISISPKFIWKSQTSTFASVTKTNLFCLHGTKTKSSCHRFSFTGTICTFFCF